MTSDLTLFGKNDLFYRARYQLVSIRTSQHAPAPRDITSLG
jgi:hypothetical protein